MDGFTNDSEYSALLHEYSQLYRPLQKQYALRSHIHFDIYGNNLIEIWEYSGGEMKRCICRIKEESEKECYQRAVEELKNYMEKKGTKEHEEKAG